MEKRLYKSVRDRKLMGVCGGLGEYFNIDPMLFRLGFVILVLVFGTGLLAYFVCGLVLSDDPEGFAQNGKAFLGQDISDRIDRIDIEEF